MECFIKEANTFHPTIKSTAKISENEITILNTVVFKGERFIKESILDIKTHYKLTETFQYTHFTSCHPPGLKEALSKEKELDCLKQTLEKQHLESALQKLETTPRSTRVSKGIYRKFPVRGHLWLKTIGSLTTKTENYWENIAFCHYIHK